MTEEKAKSTQCCGPEGAGHVNELPYPARWCVASSCMAWRLLPDQPEYVDLPAGQVPGGDGWTRDGDGLEAGEHAWTRVISNRGGYCGLAGHQS